MNDFNFSPIYEQLFFHVVRIYELKKDNNTLFIIYYYYLLFPRKLSVLHIRASFITSHLKTLRVLNTLRCSI